MHQTLHQYSRHEHQLGGGPIHKLDHLLHDGNIFLSYRWKKKWGHAESAHFSPPSKGQESILCSQPFGKAWHTFIMQVHDLIKNNKSSMLFCIIKIVINVRAPTGFSSIRIHDSLSRCTSSSEIVRSNNYWSSWIPSVNSVGLKNNGWRTSGLCLVDTGRVQPATPSYFPQNFNEFVLHIAATRDIGYRP